MPLYGQNFHPYRICKSPEVNWLKISDVVRGTASAFCLRNTRTRSINEELVRLIRGKSECLHNDITGYV